MYFKDEYNEYYDVLAENPETMRSSIAGMQDSIVEVNNQFSSIALLLDEMKGDFSSEIVSGLSSLTSEINALKGIIDADLSSVVDSMSDLGNKLGVLKPEDEENESKKAQYDADSLKSVERYKIDQSGVRYETQEYKNWIHNLNELKKSIDALVKICEQLQTGCDNDIELIQTFNNSVIDLRLKLVAVATAMGDTTIEDIDNMTPQEKQAYLEQLLGTITEKYNQYKQLYEYYSKDFIRENCTDDQLYNFVDIFDTLLQDIPGCPSLHEALDSKNPVTRGNAIVDIINMLTNPEQGVGGKDILTIVTDYASGTSWKDSGMDELFRRSENNQVKDYLNKGGNAEDLFWSRATYGDSEYNQEMLNDFLHVADILSQSKDGFLENYNKALNTAIMIKGVRGLKDSLIYDYTYKTADFDNYVPNDNLLYFNGFDIQDYSMEELKMVSYLLENQGYDAAKSYIDLRQDAINRRNGLLAAQDYYNGLHDGSNTGLDSFGDHFKVGAKGLGDGLYSFTDGLIDLVAPDSQISEYDYKNLYLLEMLEESGDPYDSSLLTTYKVTNTVGVYAIPTIVNAVTGGSAGTALFISSDIGNGIESSLQHSRQHAMAYDSLVLEQESYSEALVETAIPYIATDLPNDASQAIAGLFMEINPVLGAAADVAFDAIYKGHVISNT